MHYGITIYLLTILKKKLITFLTKKKRNSFFLLFKLVFLKVATDDKPLLKFLVGLSHL